MKRSRNKRAEFVSPSHIPACFEYASPHAAGVGMTKTAIVSETRILRAGNKNSEYVTKTRGGEQTAASSAFQLVLYRKSCEVHRPLGLFVNLGRPHHYFMTTFKTSFSEPIIEPENVNHLFWGEYTLGKQQSHKENPIIYPTIMTEKDGNTTVANS